MFKWFKKKPPKMSRGLAEKEAAIERKVELANKLIRLYGDKRSENIPVEYDRRHMNGHTQAA